MGRKMFAAALLWCWAGTANAGDLLPLFRADAARPDPNEPEPKMLGADTPAPSATTAAKPLASPTGSTPGGPSTQPR